MNLKQQLAEDIKKAMKSGDTEKRSTLRLLMSAITNAEKAKLAELADADIHAIIAKEIKQRLESIEAFKQGNRADLVAKEEGEMKILQAYMPAQLGRDEIVAEAQKVIAEVGAAGPGDKGKVMQQLMPKLKGKADGKLINEVVTELLAR